MRISDRIQPENLDRRELQLSLLVSLTIIILAAGLALLMYPTVFSHDFIVSGRTMRILFFGFCALAVLMVGYLLDRQRTIRRLRRQLDRELRRNIQLRYDASADLLNTLPGLSTFQDRLAMEYRRASSMKRPLSLLVVTLAPPSSMTDTSEITASFGDAAKAMARKLRGEDSIYLFMQGIFGIIFPGVDTANAYRMSDRLKEGLSDAAGVNSRFTADVSVFNYPDHAATARELAEAVCSMLPESVPGLLDAGSGSASAEPAVQPFAGKA